jgi:DNA polymerase-3 subunit alpha
VGECQQLNLPVFPPDVNESDNQFVPTRKGIRFALSAIKGVGEGVVEAILEERVKKGPFQSLYDFFKRIDTRKVGKKAVETLIESGCFDFTKWTRRALIDSIEPLYLAAQKEQKDKERGVMNLFSLLEEEPAKGVAFPEKSEEFSKAHILKREKELLGFYLTGHPLEECQASIQMASCMPLKKMSKLGHGAVCRAAFVIDEIKLKTMAKNGRKFAILKISDGHIQLELPIWPDLYEEKAFLLKENQLAFGVLQLEKEGEELRLQCRYLEDLTKVDDAVIQASDLAYDKAKMAVKTSAFRTPAKKKEEKQVIHLKMAADKLRLSHILQLKALFRAHPGAAEINLEFVNPRGQSARLHIKAPWGIAWNKALEQGLSDFPIIQVEQT